MAQLNVAREPSMDEILASIRKIIESNEPGQAGFAPQEQFEDEGNDEIELTIDSEIETIAFGRRDEAPKAAFVEPVVDSQAGLSEPSPAAQPPLSLADVAARVRAASERHTTGFAGREVPPAPQVVAIQDSPVVTSRMAAVSAPKAPVIEPAAAVEAPAEPEVVAPPPVELPEVLSAVPPVAAVVPPEAPAPETALAAIVSPEVGRKVAQSFGDLAHAVDQESRRSFDEIAEAMLRPMLQEWLDDNLPTLVERLVREEIERVARGPRR
ncbi:PopZ family protein [Ensifer adhaerens]|uniref:PopZ family protein n=1 Tax=Ensifer TaxID=106591 RepID=UPI000965CDE1|nr:MULTISPECIES: PopZ family protein [Ensifer]MBD9495984.1 DUF2497 domain-containing protein [Ensifer sp. ENS01]MBD9522289.1 DUF2497 domain-containing protein [Ensifer sp. ENS02]MBD9622926.1 DUF2497 domain-containing protein [Ensifer sp. ENS06]MBW0369669.1 PopZ family protein [Ensifer adhaerens]OKP77399.1 hypothetical protein BTE77_13615 [Ensifer adhaerens]